MSRQVNMKEVYEAKGLTQEQIDNIEECFARADAAQKEFEKWSQEEIDRRMANFVPKKKELTGYLKRYAAMVSSGAKGAILQ